MGGSGGAAVVRAGEGWRLRIVRARCPHVNFGLRMGPAENSCPRESDFPAAVVRAIPVLGHRSDRLGRRIPPLNALHTFEVVARTGSLTAAAAQLHVTQSAVSRQVAGLEQYFGVALFTRQRA